MAPVLVSYQCGAGTVGVADWGALNWAGVAVAGAAAAGSAVGVEDLIRAGSEGRDVATMGFGH